MIKNIDYINDNNCGMRFQGVVLRTHNKIVGASPLLFANLITPDFGRDEFNKG
jgi:hypothetical protein